MKNRMFHKICTVLYNHTWHIPSGRISKKMIDIKPIKKIYTDVRNYIYSNRIGAVICDECMAFLRDFDNEDWEDIDDHFYIVKDNSLSSIVAIKNEWHAIFNDVCYGMGFSNKNTNMMWTELAGGNWKHLHKSDSEEEKTAEDWFDAFCHDVFYCSDRWSLDRLMRCHWLHRQWLRAEWEKLDDAEYDLLHWYEP